jgi:flagellar biosynthetic protein FliQ
MPSLLIGLVISTFQAATQINEQTLSFLPRLLVTLVVIIITGPWLLRRIMDYTEQLVLSIPSLVG